MHIKECYQFAVYGDSISKGVIYDDKKCRYVVLKDNFVSLVENKLKGVIFNMSKFGNNIIRGTQKLERDVEKKNPDIVLIEFGGNDCDFDWDAIAKEPNSSHQPKTDLYIFEKTLNGIIKYFKNLNIVPVLMTLPPLEPNRYFKWICKNNDEAEKNVLSWLGSVKKIYTWHEQYNSKIVEIAEKSGTELLDVRGAFLEESNYSQYLCVDGIHPNAEGHKLIAGKIMEYVNSNYNFLLKDR